MADLRGRVKFPIGGKAREFRTASRWGQIR
jgi:hypothetical protein